MIELGQMNELIVHGEDQKGFILNDPISDDTAFLPAPSDNIEINIDDRISVFVYLDNDNNMIASIKRPYATVGEYALLTAVESLRIGAFFDWGISKDLFVPDNEQRDRIYEGDQIIIRACLDERTEKVYGTTKIGKYIKASQFDIKEVIRFPLFQQRKKTWVTDQLSIKNLSE